MNGSNLSFSYRFRFQKTEDSLQIDSINSELKISLWNILFEELFSADPRYELTRTDRLVDCLYLFWRDYLKLSSDIFFENIHRYDNLGVSAVASHFKNLYFNEFQWFQIYDFLEFIIIFYDSEHLKQRINNILQRELSAWRFVGSHFVQVTSEQEISMLDEALNDEQFQSVSNHLSQALQLMSDKQSPDYRNSIKESISAVESLARIITNKPTATLGKALGKIEQSGKLHPTLKVSFSALYGYTSDEHGIRHSMLAEPNLTIDDAKFFLLSCTSFINYLKAKM